MLAINNIKKSKSTAITLTILTMFSILFLYIGSSVLLDLDSFFDNKVNELNDANVSLVMKEPDIFKDCYSLINNNPHTVKTEAEDILSFETATFKSGKSDITSQFVIGDADNKRTISNIKLTEKGNMKKENGILLSYNFKSGYGYKVGDKITIKYNNTNLIFTVYGFFEDTIYSNNADIMVVKTYLFHDDYEKLKASLGDTYKYKIINAKTDTIENSSIVRKECTNNLAEKYPGRQYSIAGSDSSNAKISINMYIGVLMAILIGFSLILDIIALIVIGFSIVTYITDNIKNIGVLQAMGYVNNQIISISLLQFIMITATGSMVGLIAAFIATPYISNIISSLVGLKWVPKINLAAAILNVIIILFLVIIITYLTARKIKKITPINALRSGISTHNFRKNHISLDDFKGSINFALSLKAIFHYIKQNCMFAVIIFTLTFVSTFATITYYNFVVNNNFIINMIGIEKLDASLQIDNGISDKIYNEIKDNNKVQKVTRLFDKSIILKNEKTRLYICDDYLNLENEVVYRGREPIHDNEAAISNSVAKSMNKEIGDTISIKVDNISKDFLIVGISQHMTAYGRSVHITEEGYRRYYPNYKSPCVGIYLKNGANLDSFIIMLNEKYGNNTTTITNNKVFIDSIVGPLKSPISLMVMVFLSITVFVVCLILLLLTKIRVLKERSHLGLLKALGYTTTQLVFQTVFSLLPIIIIGVLLGASGGCLLSNSLMTFIMLNMGIYNCNLIINYEYVSFVVIGIVVVSCIFASLISYRIRKITPYELMDN